MSTRERGRGVIHERREPQRDSHDRKRDSVTDAGHRLRKAVAAKPLMNRITAQINQHMSNASDRHRQHAKIGKRSRDQDDEEGPQGKKARLMHSTDSIKGLPAKSREHIATPVPKRQIAPAMAKNTAKLSEVEKRRIRQARFAKPSESTKVNEITKPKAEAAKQAVEVSAPQKIDNNDLSVKPITATHSTTTTSIVQKQNDTEQDRTKITEHGKAKSSTISNKMSTKATQIETSSKTTCSETTTSSRSIHTIKTAEKVAQCDNSTAQKPVASINQMNQSSNDGSLPAVQGSKTKLDAPKKRLPPRPLMSTQKLRGTLIENKRKRETADDTIKSTEKKQKLAEDVSREVEIAQLKPAATNPAENKQAGPVLERKIKPLRQSKSINLQPIVSLDDLDRDPYGEEPISDDHLDFLPYTDTFCIPIMFSTHIHHDYNLSEEEQKLQWAANNHNERTLIEFRQAALCLYKSGFSNARLGREDIKHTGHPHIINDVDLYYLDDMIYVATERGLLLASDYLHLIGIPDTQHVRWEGTKPLWAKTLEARRHKRNVHTTYPITQAGVDEGLLRIEANTTVDVYDIGVFSVYKSINDQPVPFALDAPHERHDPRIPKIHEILAFGRRPDGDVGWFSYEHTSAVPAQDSSRAAASAPTYTNPGTWLEIPWLRKAAFKAKIKGGPLPHYAQCVLAWERKKIKRAMMAARGKVEEEEEEGKGEGVWREPRVRYTASQSADSHSPARHDSAEPKPGENAVRERAVLPGFPGYVSRVEVEDEVDWDDDEL